MLWNLEAEQKRRGLSNEQMAQLLSVSRATYEVKKKNGMFSLPQIETLLNYFKCDFDYLFKRDEKASQTGEEPCNVKNVLTIKKGN